MNQTEQNQDLQRRATELLRRRVDARYKTRRPTPKTFLEKAEDILTSPTAKVIYAAAAVVAVAAVTAVAAHDHGYNKGYSTGWEHGSDFSDFQFAYNYYRTA